MKGAVAGAVVKNLEVEVGAIVGIDPGKDGAIVALDRHGALAAAYTAQSKYVIDGQYRAVAMALALEELNPALVILERQQSMPHQGVASTFAIGRGYGLWEGIVAMMGVPLLTVRPREWQRVVLPTAAGEGKSRAILVAEARIPGLNLLPGRRRRPHSGLADAGCLALYGLSFVAITKEAT